MGAEGWAAYSPSSTSTSTQASRSATRTVNYTYDDLHRLTSEVLGGSEETGTVAYTLDDVGNRLGRTSSVAGITPQSLSYSANDWLNSHQYDANGNTLRSDLTSGSVARDAYDFKNRLSQRRIYDASGTVLQKMIDLRYDGDGSLKWKRVTDTTTGEETIRYFVVDHHNLTGYSQIVEELDATGAVVATYHYGHDLISQSRLVVDPASGSSDWVDRLFLYDGGGSVRALTDLEGNITDTFSYDAYGNLLGYSLSAIGDCPTFYLYRGERWDPDLGQYYLRARFYDANLGRFHTLDEYEGRTGEPLSLHKYLYAHANPVSGWDPSGQCCSLAEVNSTVLIQVAVISIGVMAVYSAASRGAFTIDIVWMTQALNDLRDRLFEWEVNADRTGAGKSDPHGCGQKSVESLRRLIEDLEKDVGKLQSGPPEPGRKKKVKDKKDKIKNLRKKIDKMLKGDTHHTKGQ